MGMHTPWGTAQSQRALAKGITQVSTAGHGGIKLSPERNAFVHEAWRNADGWYEEDCEWAIVAVTFPDAFTGRDPEHARSKARNQYPDAFTAATGEVVTLEQSRALRERAFAAETADKLVTIAASGDWHKAVPKGHVLVTATLGGDRTRVGEHRHFIVPKEDYVHPPDGSFVVPDGKYPEVNADGAPLVAVAS